ncbi:cell wall hydrolase [Acinetobacter brisouii]|uniref:cell wall hydrolase n=1 Tax=Acinetobacter brisouii TaxID=396323 RepID=UPI00124E2224|nr:cell wall hydrolase [Acinetobacter brisouii]
MILTTALTCLALNIYHESRGESELGKKIVAQSTLNRVKENNSSVCEEVLRPHQFSWTSSLVRDKRLRESGIPKDSDAWDDSKRIAQQALNGNMQLPRRYRQVTSFHAISIRPRHWSKDMRCLGRIGGHIAYAPTKSTQ